MVVFIEKLRFLKNDLSDIQGKFTIENNCLYIEYLKDFHRLDDIVKIIFNRFNVWEIDVELVDIDTIIIYKRGERV